MATEKRERQRAGKSARREAEAKKAKRDKLIRRGAIVVVVAAVVVGTVALLSGGGDTSSTTTSSAASTTAPAPTTTTTQASSADKAAQAKADAAAVAAGCPSSPSAKIDSKSWPSAPPMTIDAAKTYTAKVETDLGAFTIALDPKKAPNTVNNFVFLSQQGFYHCVTFHRVIPNFMDQTGDPTGTGSGGPGYKFADELPATASPQYPIGSVAMANAGPNTNGSQFFIVTGSDGESLQPNYSLFGQVTDGMDVVQAINKQGTPQGVPPAVIHRILSVTISSS